MKPNIAILRRSRFIGSPSFNSQRGAIAVSAVQIGDEPIKGNDRCCGSQSASPKAVFEHSAPS